MVVQPTIYSNMQGEIQSLKSFHRTSWVWGDLDKAPEGHIGFKGNWPKNKERGVIKKLSAQKFKHYEWAPMHLTVLLGIVYSCLYSSLSGLANEFL